MHKMVLLNNFKHYVVVRIDALNNLKEMNEMIQKLFRCRILRRFQS